MMINVLNLNLVTLNAKNLIPCEFVIDICDAWFYHNKPLIRISSKSIEEL